jgi:non-ribosomal peptide synthetase component F
MLNGKITVDELFILIKQKIGESIRHQHYPYDDLIQLSNVKNNGSDSLLRYNLNYYNAEYNNKCGGFDSCIIEKFSGHQSYSMQIVVKEWVDNEICLYFDYKTDEYTKEYVQMMIQTFLHIIKQIINNNRVCIGELELVDKKEYIEKVNKYNYTSIQYKKNDIVSAFENTVNIFGNKIALEHNTRCVSYATLNSEANRIASFLIHHNIKNGDLIAIMVQHSFSMFVAILGVLKCGAAYIPIDTHYPIKRVEYILNDSECKMMLCDNDYLHGEIDTKVKIVNFLLLDLSQYSNKNKNIKIQGNDLAYIIYTSGSTGKPKGVMIEHKSIINYLVWANRMYIDKGDVMACYTSISFDLTVTSIFVPFISGNRIIIYSSDNENFVLDRILRENRCTIIKLTLAHLNLIKSVNYKWSRVNKLIVGGDALRRLS